MEPILDVWKLSVVFHENPVFRDLSFQVPPGASVVVLGPNGAGKTVLFRALLGAVPFNGCITWAAGVKIGYVPQKLDVERDIPITAQDLLEARLTTAGRRGTDTTAALDLVGLPRAASRRPIGALSGGQFQRLLVAFALLGDPNVLLLDEPTAGVDGPGEERLNALLQRLRRERGLTILLISHELTVVHAYATHVLCLGHAGQSTFGPPSVLTPELFQDLYADRVAAHTHAL